VVKTPEKTGGNRIPKITKSLNTIIAVVLIILGIYHFTQPNAAWRSGTLESVFAISLLTAAYLVSPTVAIVINSCAAVMMVALGMRHSAIGGGWLSGSIELLFAVILIVSTVIIYKKDNNK
jgi:uncharacterized membrane protein